MISKVTLKEDTAIIWVPYNSNLYSIKNLPTFDFGRVSAEPYSAPRNLDEYMKPRKIGPTEDVGFQFIGWNQKTIKRVVEQFKTIQRLNKEDFESFSNNWVLSTKDSLPVVLASLDCDPFQKESYSINTNNGLLRCLFPKKFSGFGINLLGPDFIVEVVINKGQFVWTNYQYKGFESCNYLWLKLCLEIDNAKTSETN